MSRFAFIINLKGVLRTTTYWDGIYCKASHSKFHYIAQIKLGWNVGPSLRRPNTLDVIFCTCNHVVGLISLTRYCPWLRPRELRIFTDLWISMRESRLQSTNQRMSFGIHLHIKQVLGLNIMTQSAILEYSWHQRPCGLVYQLV